MGSEETTGAEAPGPDSPEPESAAAEGPASLHEWSARKLQPRVLVYVALVFVVCMALAYFVFDSMTGVKGLAIASVGAIVPLIPGALNRTEYRLTDAGIESRTLDKKNPKAFEEVLRWDELDHIVPIKDGFKFYKPLNASGTLRRFWRAHVSDAYSGEVNVEATDRERVLQLVGELGVPTAKPSQAG